MDERFSAFVFKIQANMNKAHRDRIAFMRICSGRFEKGMEVMHMQQTVKSSFHSRSSLWHRIVKLSKRHMQGM